MAQSRNYPNSWCKRKGITTEQINQHQYSNDLMLLIAMRDSIWDNLTFNEQAVWGAYWGKVFVKNFPLHNKALKKLEQITINTIKQ